MSGSSSSRIPAWLETSAAISWRVLVLVAAAILTVVALAHLTVVVIPVIGALFVSAIFVPPARWLKGHGWPPLAATWAVFLVALAGVVGLGLWLVPTVGEQFGPLGHTLADSLGSVRHWLVHGPLHLRGQEVDRYINEARDRLTGAAGSGGLIGGGRILQGAASGLRLVVHLLATLALTVVVSFFFVKDGHAMGEWFLNLLQPGTASRVQAIGTRAWTTLSGYVRGTAINGLVNGILMALGLVLLGVPLVPAIGVLTFFGGFFPIVGAFVSGAVAALVALVAKGPGTALLVVGLTVVIHHVEGYLVGPFVLGRALRLHPVVVLLALAAGGTVAGVLGAFIAVPVTAVTVAIVDELRRPDGTGGPGAAVPADGERRPARQTSA
jgi:predicted PurR-regulated permease PerM